MLKPAHIMILTGEPSGDFHAAPLIRALKGIRPGIRITGIGGPAMAGEGADLFFSIDRLSAMGLVQVIRQLGSIREAFRAVQNRIKTDPPDIVVLIDYPGFNLKVAQYIKETTRIPVCYYIAPKVWAWNAARLKKIKAFVDHLALILPFEPPIYRKMKIPATYVGNPLTDEYPYPLPCPPWGDPGGSPVIGLLPGSRRAEIDKLLPVMLDSAKELARIFPGAKFLVSAGSPALADKVAQMVHSQVENCRIVPGRPLSVFKASHMLIAASGTVTLEAALCGIPTILIYKVSPLTYHLGKILVKVKYAGLANLILDREVMPELIQDKAVPQKICPAARSMIRNLENHRKNLAQVRRRLGPSGAPLRTAKIVLSLMRQS